MPRTFVVYEVWTTARLIEATDEGDAYAKGEPPTREGLNLCNWHIVPLQPVPEVVELPPGERWAEKTRVQ